MEVKFLDLQESLAIYNTKDILKHLDIHKSVKDLSTFAFLSDLKDTVIDPGEKGRPSGTFSSKMSDGSEGKFVMTDKFMVISHSEKIFRSPRVDDVVHILRVKRAALGDGFLTKRGDVFWTDDKTAAFYFRTKEGENPKLAARAAVSVIKGVARSIEKAKTMRDINILVETEAKKTGKNYLKTHIG